MSVDREALSDRDAAKEFIEDALLTRENAGNYMNRQIAQRLATMAAPEVLAAALTARDVNLLGADAAVGSDGALDLEEAEKLVAGYEWRQADDDAEIDLVDPRLLKIIELAEQPIDDRVSISLNGKPVASLSPGQRSSAMLPLIALAEDNPLIIDQPEDNLDNAMVGKILTRILADLKEQRQIIVATHNPNIVVGGDAEQVVVLDAPEARRASVAGTGSIDDPGTIASVLRIMEGGKEAFESRSRRYGLS